MRFDQDASPPDMIKRSHGTGAATTRDEMSIFVPPESPDLMTFDKPLQPVPVITLDPTVLPTVETTLQQSSPIENLEHLALHVAQLTLIVGDLYADVLTLREEMYEQRRESRRFTDTETNDEREGRNDNTDHGDGDAAAGASA